MWIVYLAIFKSFWPHCAQNLSCTVDAMTVLHCRCNDGAKKSQSFIKLTFEFTLYSEVYCFQYCCTVALSYFFFAFYIKGYVLSKMYWSIRVIKNHIFNIILLLFLGMLAFSRILMFVSLHSADGKWLTSI